MYVFSSYYNLLPYFLSWAELINNSQLGSKNWRGVGAVRNQGTDKFIAISANGYVSENTDGENWSTPTQDITDATCNGISTQYFAQNPQVSTIFCNNGVCYIKVNSYYYKKTFESLVSAGEIQGLASNGTMWTYNLSQSAYVYNYGTISVFLCSQGSLNRTIYKTIDGINFTTASFISNDNYKQVVWGNGKFVTLGQLYGRVQTSADGENWSVSATLGRDTQWESIMFDGKQFIAISDDGFIVNSKDAINWSPRYKPINTSDAWNWNLGGNGKKIISVATTGYWTATTGD